MKTRDYTDTKDHLLSGDDPIARNMFLWFPPILSVAIVLAARYWAPLLGLLLLTVPPFLIAIFDLFQTKHTLRRLYPFTARFRWFFEDLRPFLRSYIVEGDHEGMPFSRDQRALVYARAKRQTDAQPFGTELDVYGADFEWLSHSMSPEIHAVHDPRVMVGNAQCKRPYSASCLNISAMSYGSLGAHAITALNLGAKAGGFYHDTGEGGISPYHRQGGDLVWELGTGYFGARTPDGAFDPERFRDKAQDDQVKMVELKLSQGAKPGKGGMLPGAKVTKEIADIRGVPEQQDVLSPAAHSAFTTPIGLLEFLAKMRDLSGGKPAGIKFCVGYPHELFALCKAMLETGIRPDFIVVDGGEGGTGAAPQEMSDRVGMPLREGLIMTRNALVGCGLKDDIRLVASGKVHSAAGLAMNFAIGADWCNAARAFMFSLGCVQAQHCHTGKCPSAVATTSAARQRGLVIADKAPRVANFHAKTVKSLRDIMVASGIREHTDFRPFHLRMRLNPSQMKSVDMIYEFLETGQLLAEPGATRYARHWQMAQAESFRPVC
ncbi:FMN-binding glutamate synthase family protein [Pacificimonas sp. WHA3]|uniref:FMN-binding glutamate synthase family protein n=1 Tax=Pacificimonas pallii TaxID=2827236 RepID=A0ABS6SF67_9SPHN|nr:FMN-binding glutamate synthase family protein [Pacificimonas pallii]MBV7256743.1 FMN-binding glutamate synthase family protein [Pacificimonas pallii]